MNLVPVRQYVLFRTNKYQKSIALVNPQHISYISGPKQFSNDELYPDEEQKGEIVYTILFVSGKEIIVDSESKSNLESLGKIDFDSIKQDFEW